MNNKMKEGVSVKEIESFAKKHRFEVVFCLSLIFACFFSFVFFGAGTGIFFATAGGILGIIMPGKVEFMAKKVFNFIFKQEQTVQIVLGTVLLIISIFLPPVIFFIIALHGGKDIRHHALEIYSKNL